MTKETLIRVRILSYIKGTFYRDRPDFEVTCYSFSGLFCLLFLITSDNFRSQKDESKYVS